MHPTFSIRHAQFRSPTTITRTQCFPRRCRPRNPSKPAPSNLPSQLPTNSTTELLLPRRRRPLNRPRRPRRPRKPLQRNLHGLRLHPLHPALLPTHHRPLHPRSKRAPRSTRSLPHPPARLRLPPHRPPLFHKQHSPHLQSRPGKHRHQFRHLFLREEIQRLCSGGECAR